MARMPGTTWDGEHGSRVMDQWDIVCIHTIVGRAPAPAAHFSTFMDGRPPHQSRDTNRRSAANLDGNHRVIAIENEDTTTGGRVPTDTTDWPQLTDSQVDDCARIVAFAHTTHGVPLQLCPDSRPGSRGLAYHRQGIDGNFGPGTPYPHPGRVAGGEVWTSSPGKVCPTDARIDQLPEILRRAIALVRPNPEEAYMASTDAETRLIRLEAKVDDLLEAAAAEKQRDRASWKREQRIEAIAKRTGKTADQVLDELEAKA